MATNGKTRIAILGGGVGSLAAAFALTDQAGWSDRYDLTVYQMGWRLGGKGASGRNPARSQSVEEHGLHIWMGCYENAFQMIQKCYQELGRPPGTPLARWDDAFKTHSLVSIFENIDNRWLRWDCDFPTNDHVPGQGGACLTPWNFIVRLLQWMWRRYRTSMAGDVAAARTADHPPAPESHLFCAAERAEALESIAPHLHLALDHQIILGHLDQFLHEVEQTIAARIAQNDGLRRDWILLSLAGAIVRGVLRDDVIHTGFDPLDRYDFREWLQRHGAPEIAYQSAPVRALYDLVFAYEQGDMNKPNFAAGVALRALLRTTWGYQGAFAYKMQAGMGDVVFTPLYLVLRKRGVHFQFFHRVEGLTLSADKRSIAAVRIGRQATLKQQDREYEPLVCVKDLLCWPSTPCYEQLVEGDALRRLVDQGYEPLESAWSNWKNVEDITLKVGTDFDLVVLGIPVGSLPYLTKELMENNARWRDMVTQVKTVQTQAFQLWLKRDADGLGWHGRETALLGAYRASASDMSQLIPRENWPPGDDVHCIPYFCNPLADAATIPDPFTDPEFPRKQTEQVRQASLDFLTTGGAKPLWPLGVDPNHPDVLNWDLLAAPAGVQGARRFDHQFWRANIDPNERYVLSVRDSTRYRLRANESGFANLYLTGDWVLTGLNAGCVEAAVMAGMQVSRALCGRPAKVFGETDACGGWWGSRFTVATAAVSITVPVAVPAAAAAKPTYIERGGEQVYSQPVSFQGVRFSSFLLPADLGALQTLCDRYLNQPAQGRAIYRPLLPRVLLGVAAIARAQPTEAPGSQVGWIQETDVAFWVPVVELHRRGDFWLPVRLAWFQPYLFVDNPWAAAAGREIYGFHKAMARITSSPSLDGQAEFRVETLAVPRFNPQTEVDWKQLLKVYRADRDDGNGLARRWDHPLGAFLHFVETLAAGGVVKLAEEIPALHLGSHLDPREVSVVFLKQFRDVADGRQACYQAVVEAPARVVSFREAGVLAGDYRLAVGEFDTHPVIRELGLAGPEEKVLGAWYVDFDFIMETGTEVWKS